LRTESTGPLLNTPRSSADSMDEKPATGGVRRCTDSNPRQPATHAEPSRAIPAPPASGPRQPPGRTRIPAATRHTRPGRERTPSPSRDPSTRLAARRIAQVNTARPPPGPGGHACRGSTPGAQGRGLTPQPRRPRWPLHADAEPGRPGPRQTGPVPRGNDTQINPPLQILSRPRPATAGPGGPRAARTLLRASHPALCRVPVTLHRSCTPELGTSCDVAVHSNVATRTAPDPLSRQETRIRRPGRTPPGSDAAQPVGSHSWVTPHHPTRV
jgi:hypothetical protein